MQFAVVVRHLNIGLKLKVLAFPNGGSTIYGTSLQQQKNNGHTDQRVLVEQYAFKAVV